MSAPSGEKKKRGMETAAGASASTPVAAVTMEPEERSVKQRCDPAADASSSPAPSIHSSATPLTLLPSVLVHLVMQQLSLEELARLASTCKLMRTEALQPTAGQFTRSRNDVVSLNGPPAVAWLTSAAAQKDRTRLRCVGRLQSPLGRAHLPVTVDACLEIARPKNCPNLVAMSLSQRAATLIKRVARWSRIETLDLEDAANWPEEDALTLLRSPAMQRIKRVESAGGVWLRESVQTALCRLTQLNELVVTLAESDPPSLRLHPSAFAHATSLRSLGISGVQVPTYKLAGLVSVPPQLTRLTLSVGQDNRRDAMHTEMYLMPWLIRHSRSMLSHLRVLTLGNFNLGLVLHEEMRDWLRAMPALRCLDTDSWDPNKILSGLIDAGADRLPELRVVRFTQDQSGDTAFDGELQSALLRQFLAAYPRVRYCLNLCGDGEEHMLSEERFASWPQVCTSNEHADPDVNGIVGECAKDSDAEAADEEAVDEPEEDGAADDASEGEVQPRKLDPPSTDPPLSVEESLRIIDEEYRQALADEDPVEEE